MTSCTSPAATLPAWLSSPAVQPATNRSRQWWPAQPSPDSAADGNTPALVPEDEESLEELTALCLQTGESPSRSLDAGHVTNKATVLEHGDLARSDTQDSTCTANLLPMLQVENTQQLEPPLQRSRGLGDPSSKAASKVDAVMLATADDIGEDIPLVSSRKNSILDIVSGRRTISNVVGSGPTAGNPPQCKLPFLQTTTSSASTGTNSNSMFLSASDSSTGSCEPWGGGLGASCSDASVPSALSVASASGASASLAPLSAPGLASYSAEAAEACRLLYVGVFLTPASRDVLLSMVPAVHPLVRGDHMTLVFKPSVAQLLSYPLGVDVQLQVLGTAADGRVQAVFVEAPSWLETSSACAHITISVSPGAQAFEAGRLIRDALQQAAEASTSDPTCQDGPGAYQHLPEPLPLIGRLGLKMALPAAAAASLAWAASSPGALGPVASSSGDVEVVAYSIEDLAASGCISIDQEAIKTYNRRHGRLLGKVVSPPVSPSPTALALPPVHELAPSIMDLFPKVCSPAAAASPEPAAAAATPSAALRGPPGFSSPVLQCAAGGGAFAGAAAANSSSSSPLLAAAAAYSPVSTASPFSLSGVGKTPVGAAADAVESPPDSPKSSSSSSGSSTSSSSSVDAVQFLSAVHEGDYVAVRPFVPAEGSERLLQGYVREFACYEPFQADGVLAVLTDNTIGYVAMVLDSAGSCKAGSSNAAGLLAPTAAAPADSHKKRSSKASSKTLSVAYPVDPTSAPGSSKPQAPAEAALGDSSSGIQGPLREWMQTAGSIEAAVSPVSPDLKRRNAADAERDLQLWREFEALQRKHGEALCNSILESCNHDFEEAMELIKGQGSSLQAAAAAAVDSSAPSPRAPASASKSTPAAATGAAAPGTAADDGLVQQLAMSLGLLPADAVKLARLVPDLCAEVVVQELQKQLGDVGAAADALLSGAAAGGSGRASPACSTASSSPEARVTRSFLAPGRTAAAQQLQEMAPGLSMDMAQLLVEEHGGDVSKAAEALSDMQASELEARTSAAAGSSSSVTGMAGSSTAQHAPTAGASSSRGVAAGMEDLTEADQLAILAALGEFEPTHNLPQQQEQQQPQQSALKHQLVGSPVQLSPVTSSPRRSAAPHMTRPGPAYYAQPEADTYPHTFGQHHAAAPPPPPPPRAAVVESFVDMENKRRAMEATDALYKKAKTHNAAADVLTTAAQDDAKNGDMLGCRQKLEEANKLRQQAKAAVDEAQRLSWSAHNSRSSVWEVDLHGLGVTKAIAKFAQQFKALQLLEHPGGVLFRVIVGQGKHSEDKVPKIKLGILQYLEEQSEAALQSTGEPWSITWEVDPCNPGVVNVHLPAETKEGDA